MDASEFTPLEGRVIELEFDDGYRAVVRLVGVSAEHEGADLVYDVLQVLSWGPIAAHPVVQNAMEVADSRHVKRCTVRDSAS